MWIKLVEIETASNYLLRVTLQVIIKHSVKITILQIKYKELLINITVLTPVEFQGESPESTPLREEH